MFIFVTFNKTYYVFIGYDGCALSTQELTCLALLPLLQTIDTLACDVETEDEEKKKKCKAGFKVVEDLAKTSCKVSLIQICDETKCPENKNRSTCKKLF